MVNISARSSSFSSQPRTVLSLVVSLLCWLFSTNSWALLTAEVPKKTFDEGEYITLTIRSDNIMRGQPDFSPLQRDFNVRSTSQQMSLGTGLAPSAIWRLELSTTRLGEITIPALRMGSEETTPIPIVINKSTSNNQAFSNFFIEATVSTDHPYVLQEIQLLLTIYHTLPFNDSELTPLTMPNAKVTELENVIRGQKMAGGKRYDTIQLTYIIVPQKTGEMTIDSMALTVTLLTGGSRFSFGTKRRQVVRTDPIVLNVRPKPAEFPDNEPWLPATSVTLLDRWSQDRHDVNVGDAISRTVMIQLKGQTAHLLPELTYPEQNNAKIYTDQSVIDEETTHEGTVSKKTFSYAVVPTHPGLVQLPDHTLYWWNTEKDALETLKISGANWQANSSASAIANTATTSSTSNTATANTTTANTPQGSNTPDDTLSQNTAQSPAQVTDSANSQSLRESHAPEAKASTKATSLESDDTTSEGWLLAALVAMTLLWVITFVLLIQTRRSLTKGENALLNKRSSKRVAKMACTRAKDDVIAAASAQDTTATLNALVAWARLQFPDQTIRGLGDVITLTQGTLLQPHLVDLEAQHYQSHDIQHVEWAKLVAIFRDFKPHKSSHTPGSEVQKDQEALKHLAPLYPDSVQR